MPNSSDPPLEENRPGNPPYHADGDYDPKHETQDTPWPAPAPGSKPIQVYWDGGVSPPSYEPYIVKVEKLVGSTLTFRFQTTDGWSKGDPFEIDLDNRNLVWRQLPSTLEHADGTHIKSGEAGFLFLTNHLESHDKKMYEAGHKTDDPQARGGTGTGGGGKWPRGTAGGAMISTKDIQALFTRLARLDLASLAQLTQLLDTLDAKQ